MRDARRIRTETGGVPAAVVSNVIRLLGYDLADTIDRELESILVEAAERIRLFCNDASEFEQRVVEDVQQGIHDEFIDTCWPRCPEHVGEDRLVGIVPFVC